MIKETYIATRDDLIAKAQAYIDQGDLGEDYKSTLAEIEALDKRFEDEAKEAANLEALKGAVAADPFATTGAVVDSVEKDVPGDTYDSTEYRKAFAAYVQNGTAIPGHFYAADENTYTTDVGVIIPTTVMQRIIEKLEEYGTIYNLVTKTAYKGGVQIPTSTVKPVASWVAEGEGSDKQKKTIGYITFGAFKLRCAISMTLEVDTMALPVFEQVFVAQVAEAMIRAIEQAIINGTGTGQPTGILAETPVTDQEIDLPAGGLDYDTIIDMEAAIPVEYENGITFTMTKKTWAEVLKIKDATENPIAWDGYLVDGKPARRILGYPVELTNHMPNLKDAAADSVVMFAFNYADYVINSNLNLTVKQYEDNDTDDQITKALMLVDGKVIDKNSLVTLKKK